MGIGTWLDNRGEYLVGKTYYTYQEVMDNNWIKWCPQCHNRILTTGQIKEDKPCEICQKKKHADDFYKKFDLKGGEKNETKSDT